MLNSFKVLRLYIKVALLGVSGVIVTTVVLVLLVVWQSAQYYLITQNEVDVLIDSDLDNITRGVYNLVNTENEAVQQQLDSNLSVARHTIARIGKISQSADTIPWQATNQLTDEKTEIRLPRLLVGGQWLGQNSDPAVETAIVDEVEQLVGGTITIFQRMNDKGDMLRVATNVKSENGSRAIGSYIPAVNPDGESNPVITAVLNGNTYHGRAYVVNDWYLTVYEPIQDDAGHIMGMLYVGIKQALVEERVRQAILQTRVGTTGYVYILSGKGEDRGRYIISQHGERDGENIWNITDSQGHFIIREIIHKTIALQPGELATEYYYWQNPDDPAPRLKVARLAYFAPWDWVIGTSVYQDELQSYHTALISGRQQMITFMAIAGLIFAVLIGLLSILVAWTITRPIRQMTEAVESINRGKSYQIANIQSNDEIGILARAFNQMTEKLNLTLDGLSKSEQKYRRIFENSIEGIYQTSLDGKILSANPALARILGYDTPESLLENIANIGEQLYVYARDRERLVAEFFERGTVIGAEVKLRRKDNQEIWVSLSGRLEYGPDGAPLFIEGFLIDITERKLNEEKIVQFNRELEQRVQERTAQLASANQELEAFSYSVSHDLRAPLRSIDGFSKILLEDCSDQMDTAAREYLSRICASTHHMANLIDDLIKLSHVTRSEIQKAQVNLCTLAQEVLSELRDTCPERQVDIILPDQILVQADANLIRIALANLIRNAWKFTGRVQQARIELGSFEENGKSVYFIRDNGAGFDMTYADKLFGAFQRLHATSDFEGTGIGLAMVQRIIRRHGGRIWAEGAVNQGATFYFTLWE